MKERDNRWPRCIECGDLKFNGIELVSIGDISTGDARWKCGRCGKKIEWYTRGPTVEGGG